MDNRKMNEDAELNTKVKAWMISLGYNYIAGHKGLDFYKQIIDGVSVDIPSNHAAHLYLNPPVDSPAAIDARDKRVKGL